MESFTVSSPASKSIGSNWNCTLVGFKKKKKKIYNSFAILLVEFCFLAAVVVVISMAQETVEGDIGFGGRDGFLRCIVIKAS